MELRCFDRIFLVVGGSEEKQSVPLFSSVPLEPRPAASPGLIGTV